MNPISEQKKYLDKSVLMSQQLPRHSTTHSTTALQTNWCNCSPSSRAVSMCVYASRQDVNAMNAQQMQGLGAHVLNGHELKGLTQRHHKGDKVQQVLSRPSGHPNFPTYTLHHPSGSNIGRRGSLYGTHKKEKKPRVFLRSFLL